MTFDYYISATGDDNNAGTLESPWSITALTNNQSTYAGKRVGLIAGTYQYGTKGGVQTTLYSLFQASPGLNNPIIALNGGPSSSQPTYLASCNSSGVYSPRVAIINGADPSTGDLPTVAASTLGQTAYMEVNVTNYGNTTVDGIVIENFTFAALMFYSDTGNPSPASGVIVQNCEFAFGQNVVSNGNPGAYWQDYFSGTIFQNNLVHDLQSNASGTSSTMQACGYIQFNSSGTQITNCSFYKCCAISNKDGWQSMDVSYCYCGFGDFGTATGTFFGGTIQNYLTGTGVTVNFHHNIVMGNLSAIGESGQANEGQVNIYNCTWFIAAGTNNHGIDAFGDGTSAPTSGGTGAFDFYNNLVYSLNSPPYDGVENSFQLGAITKLGANTGGTYSTWTANYNAYGSGMTFGWGEDSGQYALDLATWQSYGYDANSTTLTANPFTGTPAEAEYETFAISGPATTAGVGGACCGAVDGSGPVGCNFSTVL